MTKLYDRLNATALRLIKKYGYSKAKYYQQVESNQDWYNEFETKELETDVIVLPSSKYSRETVKKQGDKDMVDSNYIAFIPHTNFTPKINDYFIVNDITYTILTIIRINPNGRDVIYKLELK